jgi:hypothetical protein
MGEGKASSIGIILWVDWRQTTAASLRENSSQQLSFFIRPTIGGLWGMADAFRYEHQ